MPKQRTKFELTQREFDILKILWSSEKPLVASDFTKIDELLSINTVQAVLKNLLKKNLIKVADIVYSGTVLSRSYTPTINEKDFTLKNIVKDYKEIEKAVPLPNFVATLLDQESDEEEAIKELERLLEERKKLLDIK